MIIVQTTGEEKSKVCRLSVFGVLGVYHLGEIVKILKKRGLEVKGDTFFYKVQAKENVHDTVVGVVEKYIEKTENISETRSKPDTDTNWKSFFFKDMILANSPPKKQGSANTFHFGVVQYGQARFKIFTDFPDVSTPETGELDMEFESKEDAQTKIKEMINLIDSKKGESDGWDDSKTVYSFELLGDAPPVDRKTAQHEHPPAAIPFSLEKGDHPADDDTERHMERR